MHFGGSPGVQSLQQLSSSSSLPGRPPRVNLNDQVRRLSLKVCTPLGGHKESVGLGLRDLSI